MRPLLAAVVCALALAVPVSAAWAEAVVERYTKSDGFAGMGAFEGTSLTVTSRTAQRDESTLKFTGTFLGALQRMAGAGDTITITRLDRDLVWTLDPKEQTFTEAPIAQFSEEERERLRQQTRAKGKDEPSDVVVTRNEFKVERTGAKRTINGFPCEEYLMTWLVETRDTQTGETGKSLMTNRMWNTPETPEIRAVQAEERAYMQAYVKKMGLEMSPRDAQMFLAGLTGLSEEEQQRALKRVADEMAKVKGYAITSQVEWRVEGDGGGRPGGAAGGDAPREMQELVKGLGKLFGGGGQKKGGGETAREGDEAEAALFTFYTEVKSLRSEASQPARYEVPAGYTRK